MAPDALRFPTPETAVLKNGWQTAELRLLLRRIAAETAREREATTFTLAPDAFRGSLAAGLSADAITADFLAAGFPCRRPPRRDCAAGRQGRGGISSTTTWR